MKILLTGGTGYIGSHAYVCLRENGHQPIIFDNLSNSNKKILMRLEKLFQEKPEFIEGDVRNSEALDAVFQLNEIDCVMHFAGVKAIPESMSNPLKYFSNNVSGTENLLRSMDKHNIRKIIFSSSASVYGNPDYLPIDEVHSVNPINVYGKTKLMAEQILQIICNADVLNETSVSAFDDVNAWSAVVLRYFNPVGAHQSGQIGEDFNYPSNTLMSSIVQVAAGQYPFLSIFGEDYDTPDGTGVRDYIHVMDLAEGHIAALDLLDKSGLNVLNLGTGIGYSILETIRTFEQVTKINIPFKFAKRRPGDVASSYAQPAKAKNMLNWQSKRDLNQMCHDSWNWRLNNPNGYDG